VLDSHQHLEELDAEIARLRRSVSDLTLDILILRTIAKNMLPAVATIAPLAPAEFQIALLPPPRRFHQTAEGKADRYVRGRRGVHHEAADRPAAKPGMAGGR